ncbi:hypothetical protein [Symbioplanes lichenis]|uniref:hypothetical protein n=1 Tax=Symbioplanes lichenis TaxID=1629072 RepID=UPI00273924A0|nr:hypothetical protein [Actinoplanes lichenis]
MGLFALAVGVGAVLYLLGRPVHASAAPITGLWRPHGGPGSPLAVGCAVLVVAHGPGLSRTLPWGRLLGAAYAGSVSWILALALVDGWHRGVTGRLTTDHEYLSEVPGAGGVAGVLHGFAGRIVDGQADSWTTHVAGHPPGAFLIFIGLDRIGLGGGTWAALVCVAGAGVAAVAVPVTLRTLGDEDAARAAVPFLVLTPGAVWLGVSADGLFTGVVAGGLALLATALVRRSPLLGLAAGSVLGFSLFLSYGFTLLIVLVAAVALLARRWSARVMTAAVIGAAAPVVALALAGFWWLDGMRLVSVRYYQGIAAVRPYAYWVWADLAILAVSAGPAAAVILRRAAVLRRVVPPVVLPVAALLLVVAASLSGFSKAEVERIWQPFVPWLLAGAALIPPPDRARRWLPAQATVALLVNHLLLTTW